MTGWLAAASLLLVAAGCGGGVDTDYAYGPITVTSANPASVCGLSPTLVTLTGSDFSEIVSDGTDDLPVPECTVTFIVVSPAGATPFLGGTKDRVEERGRITSATTIEVTTPLATICGVPDVTVRVLVKLPSGVFTYSGPILTFVAPNLGAWVAGGPSFPAAVPSPFEISPAAGSCFGPPGSTVMIHWITNPSDAANPDLFGGPVEGPAGFPQTGNAPDITTLGTVNGAGNIEGLSPIAVVCEPGNDRNRTARVDRVEFPDGSCTPPGDFLDANFRPPRVHLAGHGITNTSGVAAPRGHNGLNEFAGAIPESFDLLGSDFGPDGGRARVIFTAASNIFESSLPGGGLTNTAEVTADIIRHIGNPGLPPTAPHDLIQGISPPAAVCGLAFEDVDITVVLDTGSCTPTPTDCDFFAPVYEEILNLDRADGANPATWFVSAIRERFRIQSPVAGGDFGPDGGTAIVTFTSADGDLIFPDNQDGAAPSIALQVDVGVNSTIVERDVIEGVSPEAVLCPPVPDTTATPTPDVPFPAGSPTSVFRDEIVDIDIMLEGGSCTDTADDATEFRGPRINSIEITWQTPTGPLTVAGAPPLRVPSTLPLAVTAPGIFTITGMYFTIGTDFGAHGTSALVTFTAAAGETPFPGPSQTLTIPGEILNETTIVGTLPTIDAPRLTHDIFTTVTVTLDPNGSCAHYQDMLVWVAPPTIANTARLVTDPFGGVINAPAIYRVDPDTTALIAPDNVGFYSEFNQFGPILLTNGWTAAGGIVDFLGCMSSQMDVEGTGFRDGTAPYGWTNVILYDQNAGVDPITKIPRRRIGANPPVKVPVPQTPGPDLGAFNTHPFFADADFPFAVTLDTPGVDEDFLQGVTRHDAWLAEIDTDKDGRVTFVIRVINPEFGQFHEEVVNGWQTASEENMRLSSGLDAHNNVDVTIDPSSAPVTLNDDFAVAPGTSTSTDAVDGMNMAVVFSNEIDPAANPFQPPVATGVRVQYSRDGGKTWAEGGAVGTDAAGAVVDTLDPAPVRSFGMVRFDRYGNLWLSYRLDEPNTPFFGPPTPPFPPASVGTTRIMLAVSTDQGATWAAYYTLEASELDALERPYLEVGEFDSLIFTTDQMANVAWVAHRYIFIPGIPGIIPDLLIPIDDEVHARGVQATAFNAFVGPIPGAPDVVNQSPLGFFEARDARCAVGPSGELYVSWVADPGFGPRIDWNVDRDGLGAGAFTWNWPFDANLDFFGPPGPPIIAHPQAIPVGHDIAVIQQGTHAGRAVFAYEYYDDFATPAPYKREVVVQYTDDYGATQTGPITVHQANNGDQFLPVIFSDRVTGTLYITWYDTKNDFATGIPDNDQAERFSAASADGATWGDAFLLSRFTSFSLFSIYGYGDVGGGVSAFNNCVLAGWADNGWNFGEMDPVIRLYQQTTDSSP